MNSDEPKIDMTDFTKHCQSSAIIVETDMEPQVVSDTKEIATFAIEKNFSDGVCNIDVACKQIKEQLDNQFGQSWHVIIGEGFSFEITRMAKATLLMYYGGKYAILLYKC